MSVKFNQAGTQICALRCKSTPILYDLNESTPVCLFDNETFVNTCTLKSCCFAGDSDQYVCSGSDDFSVYIWSIPGRSENIKYQNDVHLKLRGHRSIVNQVRYNSHYSLLATCGVEKSIRLWTPYRLNGSHGGLYGFRTEYEPERKLYASDELLEPGVEGQPVVNEALVEDERMLAFFDSLIRKELANQVDCISDNDASTSSNDDETDTEDDDDEKKSNTTINRSDIIEFESDNEDATDNTSSSGATTASEDLSSNKPKNKVKLSLRDRLRNLQHRRTLNLTQNNEYKNVLSLLNVPFSSSSHETEHQDNGNNRINFRFDSIRNAKPLTLVDDSDEADRSPNDIQLNLIRKFNQKRKLLLTSSAPQHDVQDTFNVEPSGSNEIVADVQDQAKVDFKKKSNLSRSYRASRVDFRQAIGHNSKSSSSSENEEVKHKWHKGS